MYSRQLEGGTIWMQPQDNCACQDIFPLLRHKVKTRRTRGEISHVSEELFEIIEIQAGAWDLGLDDIPDPLSEWRR